MIENLIIIPYRNRKHHLEYFIKNSWPLIQKNVSNPYLLILEQDNEKLFNRGKLLNIGTELFKDNAKYIITHDVDINPYENILKYYNEPISNGNILNIFASIDITLGGVTKLSVSDMYEINGFTNDYYGWGCEDKNLYNRATYFNKSIKRCIFTRDKNVNNYVKRFNDVNDRKKSNKFASITNFEYNKFKKLSYKDKYKNIFSSGLNNLKYNILERKEIQKNIELIKVNI